MKPQICLGTNPAFHPAATISFLFQLSTFPIAIFIPRCYVGLDLGCPLPGGAMANSIERRASRRFAMTLPLKVRANGPDGGMERQGQTRDVSFRGLYFLMDADFETGIVPSNSFSPCPARSPWPETFTSVASRKSSASSRTTAAGESRRASTGTNFSPPPPDFSALFHRQPVAFSPVKRPFPFACVSQ